MKVLHVIPSLGPLRGGPSHGLLALSRELDRQGVSVQICATDDNGPGRLEVPLAEPITWDGVTTWFFPRQTRFYTASWPMTHWLVHNVREYDLIHIHALFSYASLPAALAGVHHRIPYLVCPEGTLNRWGMTQRRPLLKRASFRLIERRILFGAACLQLASEDERRQAREAGAQGPSAVVPLGIDTSRYDCLPSRERFLRTYPHLVGRRIILYLSRLDPIKGLDILLPAFHELRRSHLNAALVIAGSGEERFLSALQRQAEQLGIAPDVLFTGFLRDEEKLAALAAADVFVLPSHSDSFGLACLEALSAGLPVVVSKHVGIAPQIEEYGAGLAVPLEAQNLADALRCLLDDHVARRGMSIRARTLARERFSLEVTAGKLIELYGRILESSTRGADA